VSVEKEEDRDVSVEKEELEMCLLRRKKGLHFLEVICFWIPIQEFLGKKT